jgi:hypothetical protein
MPFQTGPVFCYFKGGVNETLFSERNTAMKRRHTVLLLALLAAGCSPAASTPLPAPAADEMLVQYHVPGMS